jgi:hypothetical protein
VLETARCPTDVAKVQKQCTQTKPRGRLFRGLNYDISKVAVILMKFDEFAWLMTIDSMVFHGGMPSTSCVFILACSLYKIPTQVISKARL